MACGVSVELPSRICLVVLPCFDQQSADEKEPCACKEETFDFKPQSGKDL